MLISDYCIRHPVFAIVINLILAVAGLYAFQHLSIRQLPKFELPNVSVMTVYPGASPEQVERQVTTLIEQAVASVPGIDLVTSESRAGLSQVQIRFRFGQDGTAVTNEIRAKVSQSRAQLPSTVQDPMVSQASLDATPVLYLTVSSAGHDPMEVTETVKRLLVPQLAAMDGVAQAQMLGERRYSMRLQLDPIRMAGYDITVDDVNAALRAQNVDLPGGEIRTDTRALSVIPETALTRPEEFAALVLRTYPGYLVRLKDVGEVAVAPEQVQSAIRFNGREATAVGIVAQSTANPLDVGNAIKGRLAELQASLPRGFALDVAYDGTVFIEASVHEVFNAVRDAVILVVAVICLFLGSLRSSLIALVTIPLSLLGVLGFMLAMGFSINIFTLLSVVLAIGLVVDDAIVEVENVQRHVDEGLDPVTASFVGSREIGFAVIATTLTLAAVFAPIGLIGGQIGALFREFAFTLAMAVIISGFIARTLSPMMCSRLLRQHGERSLARLVERRLEGLANGYARLLALALKARWLIALLALAGVVVGGMAAKRLPAALMPPDDQGMVTLQFDGPPTATIDYMQRAAAEAEAVFAAVPESRGALFILGSPKPYQAMAFLILAPWDQRTRSADEIARALQGPLAAIPGLRAGTLDANPLGGGTQRPVELVVRTTGSYEDLAAGMERLLTAARGNAALVEPAVTLAFDKPAFAVKIDRELAGDQGVPVATIGGTLLSLLGGNEASRFSWRGDMYKVIVELVKEWQGRPDAIENVSVRTADGSLLPLRSFVTVGETTGADSLEHHAGLRSAKLTAGLAPGASVAEAQAFLAEAARTTLDAGSRIEPQGQGAEAAKQGADAATVIVLALVFIYLMLAGQFGSFRDPVIVLAVVPLAVAGALMALAIVGGGLNLYSFIGFVTLIGLIAKHGILITEFANQLRERGFGRREAAIEAARVRLRPIIMTTVATVLGALPLALATGAGAGGRFQLGWVVIGGMLFGTFVSLFLVPAVYTLLSRRHPVPMVAPATQTQAAAQIAG